MNTVHRRTEIINILIIRRHTTANELAQEFGVSIRTIQYDIQALTPVYPIYTKQGENGGIFIREDYKPYANSLTPMEVAALHELYDWTEGIHKKVLFQIIYVFLTIFLYLLKCPQSLILSALRAFCFCGKPHISRSIFLYFRYQAWLKSW